MPDVRELKNTLARELQLRFSGHFSAESIALRAMLISSRPFDALLACEKLPDSAKWASVSAAEVDDAWERLASEAAPFCKDDAFHRIARESVRTARELLERCRGSESSARKSTGRVLEEWSRAAAAFLHRGPSIPVDSSWNSRT